MSDAPTQETAPDRPRRFALALSGLALAIVSPALWMATLSVSWMQRTGLAMWIALAAGLGLAVAAARADRRRRTVGAAVVAGLWALLLVGGFLWGMKLPGSSAFEAMAQAPAFTLPDQEGRATSLDSLTADGAALLVFYRGHW